MKTYDFDLLTIGGGSGGVRASRWAASLGAKVAICEESRYGGTCVIRGCVPKKLLWENAKLHSHIQYFTECGWSVGNPVLNWAKQKQARDRELSRLEGIYENLLSKNKVTVLKGKGKILDAHRVQVGDKEFTTRFILIAVGAYPVKPDIEGAELALTSNDIFEISKLPSSLLVLGSGYIGLEFASIFRGFGSDLSLVYRQELPLKGFDKDLRFFLKEELKKSGIKVFAQNNVVRIVKNKTEGFTVFLQSGEQKTVDQVLFATGRKAKTAGLGLDSLGVKTNSQGEIIVDDYFQTSVENIFALGDCSTNAYKLTPVAIKEGMLLAENLFSSSDKKQKMNYNFIPTAVFSEPPLAVVGLTEEKAIEKGYELKIYTSKFRPLKYTVTSVDKKTFIKIIVDKKTNKVLGAHMAGDSAPEIMQAVAVALKMGAEKKDLDSTIGIHPTSAEEIVTMR